MGFYVYIWYKCSVVFLLVAHKWLWWLLTCFSIITELTFLFNHWTLVSGCNWPCDNCFILLFFTAVVQYEARWRLGRGVSLRRWEGCYIWRGLKNSNVMSSITSRQYIMYCLLSIMWMFSVHLIDMTNVCSVNCLHWYFEVVFALEAVISWVLQDYYGCIDLMCYLSLAI